jgi:hypothetical protein
MTYFLRLVALSLFIAASLSAIAQGTIRGFVKDQETGQPVIFILVGLDGTSYGTQTDENGFYTLTKIPDGNYTLVINQFGFKEVRDVIEVVGTKVLARNYFLEKDDVVMNEVEISDRGSAQKNNVNISVESMRTKDIKRIPSVGGAPDLAQALTTLPGFISTGDQGGQIYVRGGSPVQNKVLLDGMIVYNAFHSIGLFSVFDTDIIANADVYTGGYSAQFGGRISSIMDITTRDGNKRFKSKDRCANCAKTVAVFRTCFLLKTHTSTAARNCSIPTLTTERVCLSTTQIFMERCPSADQTAPSSTPSDSVSMMGCRATRDWPH